MTRLTVEQLRAGSDESAQRFRRLVSLLLLREPIEGADHWALLGKSLDVAANPQQVAAHREVDLALAGLAPLAPWWDPTGEWALTDERQMMMIPLPQSMRARLAGDVDPVVLVGPEAVVYAAIPLETLEEVLADGYGT